MLRAILSDALTYPFNSIKFAEQGAVIQNMNKLHVLNYQVTTDSYGQVRTFPLLIANELNSKLERWFQNCKFTYVAISNLTEEAYNVPLQLEFTYSRRIYPYREFLKIKSSLIAEIDLLNYHQLVKIIHGTIEKIHKSYLSLKEDKTGSTVLDFEQKIIQLNTRFNKFPFPKKLNVIKKNLEMDSSLDSLLLTNRVRNCLEHRAGIVSNKDCDTGKNYMSIQWRYPKITCPDGEFSPLSQIIGRQQTEINFIDEVKKFRKGERITLDFYDNYKCIHTINGCIKGRLAGRP